MVLPKNIVIVEDEVITQRHLQDIFEQLNVHVSGCFDNAKETLEALKEIKCDLLLMDINIKGAIDGIQLARKILKSRHVPIVFITAHNDDETVEELLELAPYGFIGKPFSSKDIVVTLQVAYKRYLTYIETSKVSEIKYSQNLKINDRYHYVKDEGILYENGRVVKLNLKQKQLLCILIKNLNTTVDYDTLVFELWGESDIADSALRTLVYSVRKLLPDFPIVSHSKMGYMLQLANTEGQ